MAEGDGLRDGRGLGGVTSLVSDHQGTTVAAVPNTNWAADAVTRVYSDPFGADRTPAVADPESGELLSGGDRVPGDRRFLGAAGGVEDSSTGLVLLGARYYDTGLGRFISTDPELDASNPAQFNAYVYAGNNPVTFSDPSGLSWWSSIKSGASKATRAVGGFVKKYQAEIVGGIAGAVVFGGCMALTAGAGSIGCAIAAGAAGGAVTNLWKSKVQKQTPFSWKSLARDTVFGAAGGAVFGPAGGRVLGAVAGRIAPAATRAASGAIKSAASAVTSRVSSAAAAASRAVAQKAAVAKNAAAATAQRAKLRIQSAVADVRIRMASKTSCSFAGTTGILMADGSIRAIEDVKPGDKVIATDPETSEKGAREVEATHVHDDVLVTLRLENGQTIRTTEDHPFWNATDQEFQRADQLEAGDKVLDDHGDLHTVAGIDHDVTFEPAWNLTVTGLHTYYVLAGATPVLVHNCNTSYQLSLDTRPAVGSGNSQTYQTAHTGATEYRAVGGGEKVWADGFDRNAGQLLDAKFVEKPGRSPFIPGSDIPDFIRSKIAAKTADEFRRYAAVINDPSNPLTGLRVITNNSGAVPYFQGLMRQHGIPGSVVVR
jgi:RHS repeat-associated protein